MRCDLAGLFVGGVEASRLFFCRAVRIPHPKVKSISGSAYMAASRLHLAAENQFDHEPASSLQAVLYSHDGYVATVHGIGLFGVLFLACRMVVGERVAFVATSPGEMVSTHERRVFASTHRVLAYSVAYVANSRRSQHSPADSFVFARWLRCHRAWRLLAWNCLACRMGVGGRFTIVAEMGTVISGVDSPSFVMNAISRILDDLASLENARAATLSVADRGLWYVIASPRRAQCCDSVEIPEPRARMLDGAWAVQTPLVVCTATLLVKFGPQRAAASTASLPRDKIQIRETGKSLGISRFDSSRVHA